MIKRLCITTIMVAAMVLMAAPVWAGYYSYVIAENTGTDYTQLAMNLTIDIDYMVEEGYISASGLDTRVTDSSYSILPHMLAEDRLMWVADMPAGASQFIFWAGQSLLDSVPVIPGYGGNVTVADNADIELGDVYAIGIVAYIDTAAGAGKYIVYKEDALALNVTGVGELTFAVTGGNSLVATGLDSGVYTIIIISDGLEMWIEVDEAEVDRDSASAIPNTATTWQLFLNNVCPYVYYFSLWRIV